MNDMASIPVEQLVTPEGSSTKRTRNTYISLGIPVDNVTPQQAIDNIVEMVNDYKVDQRPRLVATLNVDFLVNAQGFFYSEPSHPELLQVLRDADMVTADGFPIVMLGKLAGSDIKQRVTGSDLVPALASRFAKEDMSIFFLGGASGSGQSAADILVNNNPGLRIAGVSSPMIHIQGESALDHLDDDLAIIEEINSSNADLLLIGLGNPKQELWFKRNQHLLKVPVSIGVGGTFEFIAGTVKRAPEWIQKLNMEWLFRITQDPGRLWRRYVLGLVKFGMLSLPVVGNRLRQRPMAAKFDAPSELNWNTMWGSRDRIIRTTAMPAHVSAKWLGQLIDSIDEQNDPGLLFMDCSKVEAIEMAGQQGFYDLGQRFRRGELQGALIGLSPPMRRRLREARILDVFDKKTINASSSSVPVDLNAGRHQMGCQSYLLKNTTLIYLSGHVSGKSLQDIAFSESALDIVTKRDCIVDLRYVDHIDSSAIAEMYRLSSQLSQAHFQVFFSGVSRNTLQMIELQKLPGDLNIINDALFCSRIFDSLDKFQ